MKSFLKSFIRTCLILSISIIVLFFVRVQYNALLAKRVYEGIASYHHLDIKRLDDSQRKTYLKVFKNLDKIDSPVAVELQKELIQDYYDFAISHDAYTTVFNHLEPYLDHDFAKETYDRLKQQEALYNSYRDALHLFSSSYETQDFTEAFAALSALPKDYRDVSLLYESYEKVKNFTSSGDYVSNFSNKNYQKCSVKIIIDTYNDGHYKFQILTNVTWYKKGKELQHSYERFDPKCLNGNVMSLNGTTWTFNDDGTLTVKSKTETTTFYPESYKDKKNAGAENSSYPLLGILKPAKPSTSTSKPYSSSNWSSHSNPYDVYDYDDPDDFADEWGDEFDSWDDAFMYWEDHN